LLPVGSRAEAEWLLGRILPEHQVSLTGPPRRALWRAPLNYHFLAAGRNQSCAVSVSGRVRRLTEWVPLGKVQSIRYEQGPLQRPLDLASVRLDVAGRRASVRYWNRSASEASDLMRVLPKECEEAREREAVFNRRVGPPPAPSSAAPSLPIVMPPPSAQPLLGEPQAAPAFGLEMGEVAPPVGRTPPTA
jgi:hypothetical protein